MSMRFVVWADSKIRNGWITSGIVFLLKRSFCCFELDFFVHR